VHIWHYAHWTLTRMKINSISRVLFWDKSSIFVVIWRVIIIIIFFVFYVKQRCFAESSGLMFLTSFFRRQWWRSPSSYPTVHELDQLGLFVPPGGELGPLFFLKDVCKEHNEWSFIKLFHIFRDCIFTFSLPLNWGPIFDTPINFQMRFSALPVWISAWQPWLQGFSVTRDTYRSKNIDKAYMSLVTENRPSFWFVIFMSVIFSQPSAPSVRKV